MLGRIRLDSRGGAVVELALSTLIVVPLVLYSVWFADITHWKLKLEEASMLAAMDLTGFQVNDFSNKRDFDRMYQRLYRHAMNEAKGYATSPDASIFANSSTAAVFVMPSNLEVACDDFPSSSPGRVQSYTMNEGRPGSEVPELNKHTWVTCRSSGRLKTAGFPRKFYEVHGTASLIPDAVSYWANMPMCGIGPGLNACAGGRSTGLSIMLDDWGLWNVQEHEHADIPLSLVYYGHDAPEDGSVDKLLDSVQGGRNDDYIKLAKRFWRKPPGTADVVQRTMRDVAGASEMGLTDWFHVSYRYGAGHCYSSSNGECTGHAQEFRDGQTGAYGGPDSAVNDPHTGGPWHERHGARSATDVSDGVSAEAWFNRGNTDDQHYMGVSSWPNDE